MCVYVVLQVKESCRVRVDEVTASMDAQQTEHTHKARDMQLELDKVRTSQHSVHLTRQLL